MICLLKVIIAYNTLMTQVFSPDEDNVACAILTAQEWSMKNSMLLNSDEIQIEFLLHNVFSIPPTECIKFLGIFY